MNFDNSTDCFADDDDLAPRHTEKNNTAQSLEIVDATVENNEGESHVTDTSSYDSFDFEIVSPEEVLKEQKIREVSRDANPEFNIAIKTLETKIERKLTPEEFDTMCLKYAVVLCERDEFARNKYCEKVTINQRNRDIYYQLLKHNRPITSMTEIAMRSYEDTMIAPIQDLMKEHASRTPEAIEIKAGDRVNIRHAGKVRIAEDQGGRVIVIDNKKDVSLLHMKQRKDWLDKNFKDKITTGVSFDRPNEDEFE